MRASTVVEPAVKLVFEFLVLTASRSGEARQAQWAEMAAVIGNFCRIARSGTRLIRWIVGVVLTPPGSSQVPAWRSASPSCAH